jgi:hypothetical protein
MLAILLIAGTLLMACDNPTKKIKLKAVSLEVFRSDMIQQTGRLDVLYAEKEAFKNLNKVNLFFTYFVNKTDNSMTLHGWPTKKPFFGGGLKFDTNDADIIRLKKYAASTVQFSNEIYLSPPYLDKDVIELINSSDNNLKYVVFEPFSYSKNGFGELIKFRVHFTDTPPPSYTENPADTARTIRTMALMIQQDYYFANPSPPKQDF